jgi:hypothetical protein
VQALQQMRRSKDPQQFQAGEVWEPVGPSSMDMSGWIMGRVAGRLNAVTPVPGNEDTVYIGSAAGGVWKTTNAGASWTPIFDNVGTLPIGAVTLDPNNSNVVWVGTGDKNGGGCAGYFGQGVYLSEDAGATWNARNGAGATNLPLNIVNAVAIQPTDSNVILAGGAGSCSATGAPDLDPGAQQQRRGHPLRAGHEHGVCRADRHRRLPFHRRRRDLDVSQHRPQCGGHAHAPEHVAE